jgi:glycosyltransferase involved in cell wall biosynthesis
LSNFAGLECDWNLQMRVLYDHDFFSAFGYSGITRYFYEIMTRIAVMPGCRVSPFMGFHVNQYGLEKQRPLFDHFFGIKRPAIPRTRRIFDRLNSVGLHAFEKLARPDIYHQTYYRYMLPGFKGKRIVTVYDMIYETFPDFFNTNAREIREKKLSVERADGVIAISESTRRDLVNLWNVPEEKIRMIYLGNSLLDAPSSLIPVQEPYVLYVGQRVLHKNFKTLLEVYCRNPWLNRGFRLVCFGGGPFSPQEMEMAASFGVANRLLHLSGDDATLAATYKNASALVYPSLYEGFGLPIVEAMSLGCPVILSRSSSLLEVGKEGGAFFDPLNGEELLAQLERILLQPEVSRDMRERGLRHAANFTWEKCARETAAFYREVLGR